MIANFDIYLFSFWLACFMTWWLMWSLGCNPEEVVHKLGINWAMWYDLFVSCKAITLQEIATEFILEGELFWMNCANLLKCWVMDLRNEPNKFKQKYREFKDLETTWGKCSLAVIFSPLTLFPSFILLSFSFLTFPLRRTSIAWTTCCC